MAIVLTEEKKSQGFNWVNVVFVIIFVLVIVSVGYVLFLGPESVAEIKTPSFLLAAKDILNFKPEQVLNSQQYKSLKSLVDQLGAVSSGRTNPFLSF